VQFDALQNMLRRETDRNVAAYMFFPNRMLRDLWKLRALMRDADLVVNDSFHPALLAMSLLPAGRRKIVHVYGASLRTALEGNFKGRVASWMASIFARAVAWQIASAHGRIEHDFAYPAANMYARNSYRLPTPVAVAAPVAVESRDDSLRAAVYLNPHFRDPGLADALQAGLAAIGIASHCVGEGYARKPGWIGRDEQWVDRAAQSDVIVSAPGMGALSIALVYQKPIVLVLTDQPEQAANAARAADLQLRHRVVVWKGDATSFTAQIATATQDLLSRDKGKAPENNGADLAASRLGTWIGVLLDLARIPKRSCRLPKRSR
jgi:hypothetical protein